jgi:OOP family OmpA-OmpF porin
MSLKKLILSAVLTLGLGVCGAANAKAMDSMDVVVDNMGNIVMDSHGGCVRTMFTAVSDKCGGAVDIMKMDERIIYFNFDKSDLNASEKVKLEKLAKILSDNKVTKVKIVGFTDRLGSDSHNMKLSEKRASTVKGFLDSKVKLESSPVEVRSMGKANQVKACDHVKGKELIKCLAPNRRVEVEVDYFDTIR